MASMRLQKLLAGAGLGSRREIEEWIRAGRVSVAGRPAQLGDRAAPGDDVRLDGRRLELELPPAEARAVLLYNKPIGEVTTRRDPAGRPTVFERLPQPPAGRWINVGRLDVTSAGLLLFTTDGALAHALMHPSSELPREYLARVHGQLDARMLDSLRRGVMLEDGPARFERIEPEPDVERGAAQGTWRVVLREGRNREVRRLFAAVGCEVGRLLRIRYGPIELPRELRPGQSRLAEAAEVARLVGAAGLGPGRGRAGDSK